MDTQKPTNLKGQPVNLVDPLADRKEARKVSYKYRKPAKDMDEEILGRDGPEPTRFGDWEVGGKCTDF